MKDRKEHPDKIVIEALGGSAKVARELGFPMPNGTARVNNWKARGIPAEMKVSRPDLFWPELAKSNQPSAA